MAAGFADAHPILQSDRRIIHMLQTMTGMHEVKRRVAHILHRHCVAVLLVPGPDLTHQREKRRIAADRINTGADVDAGADQIASSVAFVVATAGNRFGRLKSHESSLCIKCPMIYKANVRSQRCSRPAASSVRDSTSDR